MAVINTVLNLRDQFSSKFKKIGNMSQQQTKQMKVLNNRLDKYRKSGVSAFTDVAKKAAVASAAFVGVTQAASAIGDGIQFVKDYQSSLSNLQAATGATAAETAEMKDQIKDLYKQNMGESWTDLTNSMTTAKQVTGQVGEELKKTTAMAVTYRDVFGEDVTQSVKAADTMMKNFGITTEESFNLLAQGHQKGLNKSDELLDTANEYSVYYKTLGYSADEMFNQFASGLENGAFNLDKVGDAVKEFGIRIKDNSDSTYDALAMLFAPDDIIEWTDALTKGGTKSAQYMDLVGKVGADTATQMVANLQKGGKTASDTFTVLESIMGDGQNILDDLSSGAIQGKDAMQKVIEKLSQIEDPIEKSTIGVALFGTQFEDMEADVIAALGTARDQFDMTTNTMQEINEIKYNDAAQAFQGIGRLVETSVLLPIADKLLPKLSEFGQWFSDNTPQIEAAIDTAFSKGAEVVDKFGQAITWAKDNANWLIPAITGLTGAILAQKAISGIVGIYKAWTTVTKGMTIAQIALNIASKASPFGWIATLIGIVIAAGVYLWKNWDTVKEKAGGLWTSLTEIWGNIKTFIVDTVTGIGEWLNSFPLGQGIMTTIQGIYDNVKTIFGGIITFVTSIFKGDWNSAWDGIVQAFSGIFGLISTYAKAPLNALIGLVNTVIESINGLSIDIPEWVPKYGGESFGFNIPKIPQFGLGTSYFMGGLARINERNGGEIVNLPNGSQVIPADKSQQLINNSKGNTTINLIVQGNLIGEEDEIRRIMNKVVPQILVAIEN